MVKKQNKIWVLRENVKEKSLKKNLGKIIKRKKLRNYDIKFLKPKSLPVLQEMKWKPVEKNERMIKESTFSYFFF